MLLSRCAQWFKDLWDAEVKWMQELSCHREWLKVDRSKWHWDLLQHLIITTVAAVTTITRKSSYSLPCNEESWRVSVQDGLSKSNADWQFIATHFPDPCTNKNWKHLSRKLNVGTGLAMSPQIARHEWTAAASMHRSISWFSACNFLKTKQKTWKQIRSAILTAPCHFCVFCSGECFGCRGGAWFRSMERSGKDLRRGSDPYCTSTYPGGRDEKFGNMIKVWTKSWWKSHGRCMRTMMSPTWWHPLHGSSAVAVVALPLKQSPRRLAKTISRLRCTNTI